MAEDSEIDDFEYALRGDAPGPEEGPWWLPWVLIGMSGAVALIAAVHVVLDLVLGRW